MSVKLSVIIAGYIHGDAGSFHQKLEHTLISLERQQLADIEVIILGDQLDERLDVEMRHRLDAFGGGISFEYAEAADMKRCGLDRATGDYITYLYPGDVVLPQTYDTMIRLVEVTRSDAVVVGDIKQMRQTPQSEGAPFGEVVRWMRSSGKEAMYHALSERPMPWRIGAGYANKVFRRSRLLLFGITFPDITEFNDSMPLVMLGISRQVCIVDREGVLSAALIGKAEHETVSEFSRVAEEKMTEINHLKYWLERRNLHLGVQPYFMQYCWRRLLNWTSHCAEPEHSQTCANTIPADDADQCENSAPEALSVSQGSASATDILCHPYDNQKSKLKWREFLAERASTDRDVLSLLTSWSHLDGVFNSEFVVISELKEGGRRLADRSGFGAPDLVTIVTVVKNVLQGGRNDHFEAMLASVAAQTYGRDRIEHIIVDGASTDGTVEYLRVLAEQGVIEYWVSEQDTGIYNAMNKGAQLAWGEYVLFLNSDDLLMPEALSILVASIQKDAADYAFADAWFIDGTGQRVGQQIADLNTMFWGAPYCHQTLLCKRQCFNIVDYDESFRITMWKYAIDLYLSQLKSVYVNKHLASFRVGGVSTGAKSSWRFKREQDAIKRHYLVPLLDIDFDEYEYLHHVFRNWQLEAFDNLDKKKLHRKLVNMTQSKDEFKRTFAACAVSTARHEPLEVERSVATMCAEHAGGCPVKTDETQLSR
ncbi:MAG: glycosyltransferase [Deltaproteobacteria bacterium]|nr:glycosyltransferase [Deltaproteobacteria bacterium]